MTRLGIPALFCLLAVVWGTAYVVTNVGLRTVPPTLLAAIRFDVAAVLLFAYVAVRRLAWCPRRSDVVPILLGSTLLVAVANAFLFAGQQHVTSAVAAILVGLVPIMTPVLIRAASTGEPLTPLAAVGVVVGFAGVVVIADPDPQNLFADVYGVALVFVSALAWALGTVLRYDHRPTLPLPAEGAWMILVGSLSLHAVSFVLGESVPAVWPTEAIAAVVYLGAISGAAGYLAYFVLLEALGPLEVSLLEYVIPVFAAIVGWFALGELLSFPTVAGFGLIVVGFCLVKRDALQATLRRWDVRRRRPGRG